MDEFIELNVHVEARYSSAKVAELIRQAWTEAKEEAREEAKDISLELENAMRP